MLYNITCQYSMSNKPELITLFSTSAGFPGCPLFPAVSATYFQTFLSSFKGLSRALSRGGVRRLLRG